MKAAAMMVEVYRCSCGQEYEAETPAQCPCGETEFRLLGKQPTQLGPCPACDDTQLIATKRGPLPCPDCATLDAGEGEQ